VYNGLKGNKITLLEYTDSPPQSSKGPGMQRKDPTSPTATKFKVPTVLE